jgi:hypothetical protein
MTKTDHTKQLAMLDPIVASLRKRGIKAAHFCPGYVEIQGHSFIYAPSTSGHWFHKHHNRNTWTRLLEQTECTDAECIADSIVGHIQETA